jgi:hypothetical protein
MNPRKAAEQVESRLLDRSGCEQVPHLASIDGYRTYLFTVEELEEGRLCEDGDPPAILIAQAGEAGQQAQKIAQRTAKQEQDVGLLRSRFSSILHLPMRCTDPSTN